jgi:hypothetical protein
MVLKKTPVSTHLPIIHLIPEFLQPQIQPIMIHQFQHEDFTKIFFKQINLTINIYLFTPSNSQIHKIPVRKLNKEKLRRV